MAYIQITTRCNMTCAHCCFSATAKGQDMDHEMYLKALTLASSFSGIVTIGGGEPTIHKHFFDFVDLAVQWYIKGKFELPPLIITNGKLPGKADKLLDMVASGAPLCVELSQDEFHDPVKDRIVERFKRMERSFDRCMSGEGYVGIRTVSSIGAWGRAAEPARGIPIKNTGPCCCDTLFLCPDGNVYPCGCKTTPWEPLTAPQRSSKVGVLKTPMDT